MVQVVREEEGEEVGVFEGDGDALAGCGGEGCKGGG